MVQLEPGVTKDSKDPEEIPEQRGKGVKMEKMA